MLLPRSVAIIIAACLSISANAFQSNTEVPSHDSQTGGSAIIYSKHGAYMIEAPQGWIMDRGAGKQVGLCCVLYPKGSSWDGAESIMYPNISDKRPGQASVQQLMEFDASQFRTTNPLMRVSEADDVPAGRNGKAKVRYFLGVNKGAYEAVAYVDEPKVIAVLVLSSKTRKAFDESLPLFREFVKSYVYMDVVIKPAPIQSKK